MIETKLICVEGIPGSGKSTLSRLIAMQAERNGQDVVWYHEVAKPHPTSFFHEAWLTEEEYEQVCQQHAQARETLERVRVQIGTHLCFDLLDLKRKHRNEIGETVYQALCAYDVWTFTSERYREVALQKWQHFADVQVQTDEVAMLDASLFQFQVYGQLLANLPKQEIKDYVHQLFAIIAPLRPVVVYLYQEDSAAAFERIVRMRGKEWAESIAERDKREPFYLEGEQKGVARYQQLLQALHELMKELFDEAPFAKIAVENTREEWGLYEQQVLDALELSRVPDPELAQEQLRGVEGTYRNQALEKEMRVVLEQGVLVLEIAPSHRKRLIPKGGLVFALQDNSVEVSFAEGRMQVGGRALIDAWSETGTVYERELFERRGGGRA